MATDFSVPQFETKPVAELPKPTQAKYESPAQRASNEAYDNFVKSLPKDGKTAGVIGIPENQSFRIVMGRVRGAANRLGIEVKSRSDHEANKVYVTLKQASPAANGAQAPVAAGAR